MLKQIYIITFNQKKLLVSNLYSIFANVNNKQIINKKYFTIMNKKETSILIALATIATNNKEGFTVSAANLQPITKGYAVAVAATQDSFGLEGLANVVKYVSDHPEINAFGGWYNSKNNMYYFDATVIVEDLAVALELGRINKQLAIFDLTNGLPIDL